MISAVLHKAQEPASQLANPIGLAEAYRFWRDQLPAYAECHGARDNKFRRVLLSHAPEAINGMWGYILLSDPM